MLPLRNMGLPRAAWSLTSQWEPRKAKKPFSIALRKPASSRFMTTLRVRTAVLGGSPAMWRMSVWGIAECAKSNHGSLHSGRDDNRFRGC